MINELKATPGPWTIYQSAGHRHCIYTENNEAAIAETFNWLETDSFEESLANANLIVASPDLHEACVKMIECTGGSQHWQGETHDALVAIEKALAKARGQS